MHVYMYALTVWTLRENVLYIAYMTRYFSVEKERCAFYSECLQCSVLYLGHVVGYVVSQFKITVVVFLIPIIRTHPLQIVTSKPPPPNHNEGPT